MREHEFPPGTPTPNVRCIHCGGLWQPQMTASCVDRVTVSLAPEPARRTYSSEDFSAIGARVAELQREREAMRTAAAPEPQMDPGDCCG